MNKEGQEMKDATIIQTWWVGSAVVLAAKQGEFDKVVILEHTV